jgi:hypothetical protein
LAESHLLHSDLLAGTMTSLPFGDTGAARSAVLVTWQRYAAHPTDGTCAEDD